MRHTHARSDEPHFLIRSLAIDYGAGGREEAHAHHWPQLLYARSGAVRVDIGERIWTLPPRCGLWIPAGTPHALRMSSRLELRTLYLRPRAVDARKSAVIVRASGLLHESILAVCAQGQLDDRVERDRCLATLILTDLDRQDAGPEALMRPREPRCAALAELFLDPACAGIPLVELYARVGLSRRTAERQFLASCGAPPAQWRRLAGLSNALVAIAGGATIDSAAIKAGYQSRGAFSEAFARTFGLPPGQARRI